MEAGPPFPMEGRLPLRSQIKFRLSSVERRHSRPALVGTGPSKIFQRETPNFAFATSVCPSARLAAALSASFACSAPSKFSHCEVFPPSPHEVPFDRIRGGHFRLGKTLNRDSGFSPTLGRATVVLMSRSAEIFCPACKAESVLVRQPRMEGFRKVGEILRCGLCGHEFPTEADVPFLHRSPPKVFSDSDRSAPVRVFADGEADQLCRHCAHYVVNPFMQWCGLHRREVEATDSCPQFQKKQAVPKPRL